MILYSANPVEGFTIAAISEGTTRTLFLGEKWGGESANKKPTIRGGLIAGFGEGKSPVSVAKDLGYCFNKGLRVFKENLCIPYLMT
jgi:hypothetical protein